MSSANDGNLIVPVYSVRFNRVKANEINDLGEE